MPMTDGKRQLRVVFERDEDGAWVTVPRVHGCLTQSETLDEAHDRIRDRLELWSLPARRRVRGGSAPQGGRTTTTRFQRPEAVWIEEGYGLASYTPRLVVPRERAHDEPTVSVERTGAQHVRGSGVAEVVADEPDRFRWRNPHWREGQMHKLTLDVYRKHVQHRTISRPDFESERETLDATREEWWAVRVRRCPARRTPSRCGQRPRARTTGGPFPWTATS